MCRFSHAWFNQKITLHRSIVIYTFSTYKSKPLRCDAELNFIIYWAAGAVNLTANAIAGDCWKTSQGSFMSFTWKYVYRQLSLRCNISCLKLLTVPPGRCRNTDNCPFKMSIDMRFYLRPEAESAPVFSGCWLITFSIARLNLIFLFSRFQPS